VRRLAAALLLVFMAPAAHAADLFAGYSMLASDPTLHGWHAALGFRLAGRIDLVVDAREHYGDAGDGSDLASLSLMAGPRLTFGGGRLRPFVQLLGGAVRTRAGIEVFEVEISEKSTDFGGAAGGGLDVGFGARWAARLAADYRLVSADGETEGDPRLSAGVVYRFGR
jgi:opacity protein-like surface antigen